jgi:hypothetical protein
MLSKSSDSLLVFSSVVEGGWLVAWLAGDGGVDVVVVGLGVAVLSLSETVDSVGGGRVEDEEDVELSRPALAVGLRRK